MESLLYNLYIFGCAVCIDYRHKPDTDLTANAVQKKKASVKIERRKLYIIVMGAAYCVHSVIRSSFSVAEIAC